MRIVRDPVTGQLRAPSHEEFKALQEQSRRDAAAARATGRTAASQPAMVPQVLQDGSVTMELDESHWSYSVATRKADGSLDLNCVTGEKAARRLMTGAKTQVSKSGKQSLQVKEHGHVHK